MFSFSPSMSPTFENFLMCSLLLIGFSVSQVFSQSPITNIGVLGNYFGGATRFMRNRPFFMPLVVPKTPLQHSSPVLHHHHHHRPQHYLHGPRKLHPLYPHLDPLPRSRPLSAPLPLESPIMLSALQPLQSPLPAVPLVHSIYMPKNVHGDKLMKPKKKSKSKRKKHKHRKHKHKSYPDSINEKLEDKDYVEDVEADPHWNHDLPDYDNHYEEPPKQPYEEPKSFYESMPPFAKPKKKPIMQTLKDKQKQEIAKNKTINALNNQMQSSPQQKTPKTNKRPKSEYESPGWSAKYNNSNQQSTPKYSERIRKPILQNIAQNDGNDNAKNKKSKNDKRKHEQDKNNNYRTATANQLSHKENEIDASPIEHDAHEHDNEHSHHDHDHHSDHTERGLEGIKGEDLEANDDPKVYPHQYAIEIRWKGKEGEEMVMDQPEQQGDSGDREMHSSKDFDHARNRKYKHEEEEHWHEKDWLNEGLRKAYMRGKPYPIDLLKPGLKLEDPGDFSPLPLYAQPMSNGATLDQINQHFAIPTPNFRVNQRFMDWAKSAIDLNGLQNNYITLYG